MQTLTLTRPDDAHLHLRDGAALRAVLPDTARRFARAVIMPNLKPPVATVDDALAYRRRILEALPAGARFEPLMTLYLTERTRPADIEAARASGCIVAVKYYPAGATTHSDAGVSDLARVHDTLAAMQDLDLPLLVHGEVTDPAVDIFDRERVFIERALVPLVGRYPRVRIVLEHITTSSAVEFVRAAGPQVAATITAHHLLLNRNALFQGGIRPHNYCLPVLKRETHRRALLEAATSGNPKFFLGTDSAPHARHTKETDCGCAGLYTAHAAVELYAEAFEEAGHLERLDAFASRFAAGFYRLPRNEGTLVLRKEPIEIEKEIPYGEGQTLVPMRAGQQVAWRLQEV